MREYEEEDDDRREADYVRQRPFPVAVMLAGIGWILFGALALLGALLQLAAVGMASRAGAEKGAYAAGQTCGVVFAAIVGAAFVFVGIQTVVGKARDTLGNSIGSIAFGVLYLIIGGVLAGTGPRGPGLVAGVLVAGALAAGLLTAGILGLVGRANYKAWRRARRA